MAFRVVYPVLTKPILPLAGAIPSLLPGWATQDQKRPKPPAPAPWLNAAQTQVFVQAGPVPSVAAWAGVTAFPSAVPRAAQGDVVRSMLPPTPGGWALTQDAKSGAASPAPASWIAFAGPLLALPPVSPLSWRTIGDGATPAKLALPQSPVIQPVAPPAPALTLGWQLVQPPAIQRQPFAAMPAAVQPPQLALSQGWMAQPFVAPKPLRPAAFADYGVSVLFVPAPGTGGRSFSPFISRILDSWIIGRPN